MSEFLPQVLPREAALRLVELGIIRYSPEDAHLVWRGAVLTFNASQNLCFQPFWKNLFEGNLPIPLTRIMKDYAGATVHPYHLFKRHDLWKMNIVVGNGRGHFWLHIPAEVLRSIDT